MTKARFLLTVTCICLFVPEIFGQSTPPTSGSEGWRLQVVPYVWGSNFKGTVGIGDHSADVDASFLDLLREMNFAFMGAFEADRNKFAAVTDLMYLSLSDKHATPGPLFSNAKAIGKLLIVSPEAGYRLAGSEASSLDVLGGVRFWHVKGELDFDRGLLDELDLSRNRNWVDGIFALKGKIRLSPKWYVTGYGDIGGGGSNLTYQLLGVAGRDFGERYALVFGYRHLHVDYNKDRFLFDTGMGGPILGFAFKF